MNKHNTDEDAWIIVDNKIYDVTNFTEHPGSHEILLRNAGSDRTEQFHAVSHPLPAYEMMKEMHVGDLANNASDDLRQSRLANVVLTAFFSFAMYISYKKRL